MTTEQRRPEPPADRRTAPDARLWVLAALLFGLLVVEGLRQGGFWPADAFVVALGAAGVLLAAAVVVPPDRRGLLVVGSILLLAAWWLTRAVTAGPPERFLPLGASMLAFAAAFVRHATAVGPGPGAGRPRGGLPRRGSVPCSDFAGLIGRWFPWPCRPRDCGGCRAPSPMPDAAGLVLGMCLLVALGLDLYPPLVRVVVCLSRPGCWRRRAAARTSPAPAPASWSHGVAIVQFRVPLVAGTVARRGRRRLVDRMPVPFLGWRLCSSRPCSVSAVASRQVEPSGPPRAPASSRARSSPVPSSPRWPCCITRSACAPSPPAIRTGQSSGRPRSTSGVPPPWSASGLTGC